MTYNLIEKALEYAKQERTELESLNLGIYYPLSPKARRNVFYHRVKQTLIKGCRRSVKALQKGSDRSIAYSILMKATTAILYYGKTTQIMDFYNGMLDDLIGTH